MKLAEKQMNPEIVSEAEWLVARKDLLTREKQFTLQRDALSAAPAGITTRLAARYRNTPSRDST
jgi:predicted dithiol-disulfide oxidoreductase (DUF899 family)